MIRYFGNFILALLLFSTVVFCAEEKSVHAADDREVKHIGVLKPVSSSEISDKELVTLWRTIEANARTYADKSSSFKVIERSNLSRIMAARTAVKKQSPAENDGKEAQHDNKADEKNAMATRYLLASNIGNFGSRHVFNMSIVDCITGENLPNTTQSRVFYNLDEIIDEIPLMINSCLGSIKEPALAAVLQTTILNPACPAVLGRNFHEALQKTLLANKIDIAMLDDVDRVFHENGIDALQSLPPRMYSKVAKCLNVQNIVISQLTACELTSTDYNPGFQRRGGKLLRGKVSGTVMLVGMNGEIKAMEPFDNTFDFNDMVARGQVDIRGWGPDQFYTQMIYSTVYQCIPSILEELK